MELNTLEQRQRAKEALFELMHSDGWKLMLTWLLAQRESNIAAMTAPTVTTEALHQLAGQTRLLDAVIKWPKQTHDVLVQRDQPKKEK